MPCYSYSQSNQVLQNNIEVTHSINGGTSYPYNGLYWICEFPIDTQLRVFKKNSGTNAEVQLILSTDFTINSGNTTINILTPLTGYDQIIIRRNTLSDKMIFRFQDGAKLSAKELNDCFHQLLFVTQEKELINGTVINNYSVSTAISAWVNGTSYVVGDLVSYQSKIYKCILATSSVVPTNTANWLLINPSLHSFVITGNTNPIEFDLSNLAINDTLQWNGSKFVRATLVASLASITEFNIASPQNGQVLIYNSSNSKWENETPTFDVTLTDLLLSGRVFYPSGSNASYHTSSSFTLTGSSLAQLGGFKDNSGRWVATDAPTVYHILKQTIPSQQDPIDYFNNISTQLSGAVANLANPIKAKLYWHLKKYKTNEADVSNLDTLDNYKSTFWDSPYELYSASGYSIGAPSPLKSHGVVNASIVYKDSPYFTTVTNNGTTTFKSKLEGYGIRSFYLSIPESHTSCLAGIPLVTGAGPTLFDLPSADTAIATECNKITGNAYEDYYLLGLRDLAFAAVRPIPAGATSAATSATTTKNRNNLSRYIRGKFFAVNYHGLESITFKRLEDAGDNGSACLWKIPKNIIYYNKQAMAFTSDTLTEADITINPANEFLTTFKRKTRFQGISKFHGVTNNFPNSTVTEHGQGTLFKANQYWSDWVSRWDEDNTNPNYDAYQFLEANIEWFAKNIVDTSSNPIPMTMYNNPPYSTYLETVNGNYFGPNILFPFLPRSTETNDVLMHAGFLQNLTTLYNGATGSLFFNIDANTVFSTASNFIPDPVDEYVFRVVLNAPLTNYFKQLNSNVGLKTATILEYGFNEQTVTNMSSTPLQDLGYIFANPSTNQKKRMALSHLKKSDIKVYIRSENIEIISVAGVNTERVVITLAICVPRLKSIGYARAFRQVSSLSTTLFKDYRTLPSGVNDTNIDQGPWVFSLHMGSGTSYVPSYLRTSRYAGPLIDDNALFVARDNLPGVSSVYDSWEGSESYIAGRNECAVKFTRLGLPDSLWIKLSVLNTDGSTALLDSTGFIVTNGT